MTATVKQTIVNAGTLAAPFCVGLILAAVIALGVYVLHLDSQMGRLPLQSTEAESD